MLSSKKFSGFKSLWQILLAWQWLMAWVICIKTFLAYFSVKCPFSIILSKSSPPSHNLLIMKKEDFYEFINKRKIKLEFLYIYNLFNFLNGLYFKFLFIKLALLHHQVDIALIFESFIEFYDVRMVLFV